MLREIKCDLSTEELLRKGQEMAQLQRDKELVEMDKKESAAEFKGKIDGLESRLSKVCAIIRDKYELRQVNCREEKDFVEKVRRIIRCDNGEQVEVHPMTPADLQQKLPKVDVQEVAKPGDETPAAPGPSLLALPQTATPEKVEPGQIWHAYGYQFEVLTLLKDGDIEVKYIHDNMRSIMSENEWKAAEPKFVAIRGKVEVVEQTDEPIPGEKKPGKKRGKRGAK